MHEVNEAVQVGPSWSLVHVHTWVCTPDCICKTKVVAHITQRALCGGLCTHGILTHTV